MEELLLIIAIIVFVPVICLVADFLTVWWIKKYKK